MLKPFKVDTTIPAFMWAGSGHTAETDPCKRGWRLRPIRSKSCIQLLGRRGANGCFTIRVMHDGKLDVAYYLETPEEVISADCHLDAQYICVEYTSGWALPHIRQAEAGAICIDL